MAYCPFKQLGLAFDPYPMSQATMSLGSTLQVLMRLAHVALVAILLVGVPMADAATCAGEELSGTIGSGIASDSVTRGR